MVASHACALDNAGVINCWGGNTADNPSFPLAANYKALDVGGYVSCGRDPRFRFFGLL